MYAYERYTPQMRQTSHVEVARRVRMGRFEKGRRCAAQGCRTVLSRYNPAATCAVHAGWGDARERQHG